MTIVDPLLKDTVLLGWIIRSLCRRKHSKQEKL